MSLCPLLRMDWRVKTLPALAENNPIASSILSARLPANTILTLKAQIVWVTAQSTGKSLTSMHLQLLAGREEMAFSIFLSPLAVFTTLESQCQGCFVLQPNTLDLVLRLYIVSASSICWMACSRFSSMGGLESRIW